MAITKGWNLPNSARTSEQEGSWISPFPNPADLNFNYRKLMDASDENGIAKGYSTSLKVAIVGAGVAGLTIARELLRSGFPNIDIYEASDRYGGRHYTKTLKNSAKNEMQNTVQEGGAMRMPPFLPAGTTDPNNGISILAYYLKKFGIQTEPFPNPGSSVANTGIYYNNGYASGESKPTMLIWDKTEELPPTEQLQDVYKKWHSFVDRVTATVKEKYPTSDWQKFWELIVTNYWDKTFRDVVMLDPITGKEAEGNWGGCGMNEEETKLFYIIGAGDGSWGAFFNLSFLYAYRTFVHGFSSDLKMMQGTFTGSTFSPGPYFGKDVADSFGSKIPSPEYLGVASMDDSLLFVEVNVPNLGPGSVYALSNSSPKDEGINIYTQCAVTDIIKTDHDTVQILNNRETVPNNEYDAVIITVPTWQTQMGMNITGFDPKTEWPFDLQTYLKRAHWEPSCKIFVGLTEPYWEKPECKIPQAIATDTFLQDIYGVKVNQGSSEQTGTLLLSYTWWRDATKLVSYSDEELIDIAVEEADRVLMNCDNIGQKISPYINKEGGYVIHWEKMPTYKGAARLYDERTWNDTQIPMAYNQEYSANSKLYFAGEAYGTDAGWTEPALRGAIDAILHLCKNNDVELVIPDFDFDTDYPKYDVKFNPANS